MTIIRAHLILAFGLLVSCSSDVFDDHQFLVRCWDAVPTSSAGEYSFNFEALVIPGTEGGIYARSRRCPDHRLGLDYGSEPVRTHFENAVKGLTSRRLGVVVRATANARVKERKTDHFMTMTVTDLHRFEVMSDAETDEFIQAFNIG